MRLYYALGGGAGHLARALAVGHTLGWDWQQGHLLTNASQARTLSLPMRLTLLPEEVQKQAGGLPHFLEKFLSQHSFDEVYLDAFPAGLRGEWASFFRPSKARFYYLARRLRWESYLPILDQISPFFKQAFLLEPLEPPHQQFVESQAASVKQLMLRYPWVSLPSFFADLKAQAQAQHREIWLVVHSQPQSELAQLYEYARETAQLESKNPYLVLISEVKLPRLAPDTWQISYFPAYALFAGADRIFSAGGFNTLQQLRQVPVPYQSLPFVRRFDDQFWRVAYHRSLRAKA
ncbi:MAG: hypothetical protein HC913_21440 [Microscillaceae bacterium]|nr:hypothetical protein [Microscillaceae bacterium]